MSTSIATAAGPSPSHDGPDRHAGGIQVIARAAAILRALSEAGRGMSYGEIAARVDLPRSTVQRIVQALIGETLVAVDADGISIGAGIARLAASSSRPDLQAALRVHLHALHRRVDETVDLSQLSGAHLRFIEQMVSTQELRVAPSRETMFPLYCTANGKAALATMPDRAIARLLGDAWYAYTPHTIATLPALLADIAAVRRTGFAYDRQEHSDGVCAIGISVVPPEGPPYAISIAVPQARFERVLPELKAALLACRAEVLATLGTRVVHTASMR